MTEFRRGISNKQWQKHWHFAPQCEYYPTKSFAIRKTSPPDNDICAHCDGLIRKR